MNELMVKILGEIRDEVKATRTDLSSRIDQTNGRLDRLERRQVAAEVRLSSELVAVATAVNDLTKILVDDRALRSQLANHESRLKALEKKRAG